MTTLPFYLNLLDVQPFHDLKPYLWAVMLL